MESTRASLLSRVRDFEDASGWSEFDRIYRPLLTRYARQRGLGLDEAEEIAQQCLEIIVGRIKDFQRRQRFRSWLRRLVENKVKQHFALRKNGVPMDPDLLQGFAGTEPSPADSWEADWNRTHLEYFIGSLSSEFAPHNLLAFECYVLDELPVPRIAELLGMTPNQIYVAKSRVIRRIRERFGDMLSGLYGIGT